jgi:NAD(P)-dependent dehydrogenase (short-subunit alcohol dehydrogenase family)
MSDFTGKRVVITGAAGIFGGWIAAAFARAGATLCCPAWWRNSASIR